ncbi:carbohydrate kinase family protein [Candidatus Woesearchaeota archaeon]|nr:carbohydrate kinase family protein [Candidatus Woesearchaeota archaeon]
MYDIITVGSATVDVFVDTESALIKIKSLHQEEELLAYPSGSKILIKHLDFQTGGGGTNTALAFRRLGHRVGYLGKLGLDSGGKLVIEQLKKNKIDFLGIKGKGITSYSIILDSIEHDRTILTYKGIMDTFNFAEINKNKLKTKWFYFSSLTGSSYKVLEKLSDYAVKNKIKIAFNPSSYLAEKGRDYLRKVIDNSYILVLNKEEAELIVGKGDIKNLLKRLYDIEPDIVVITDGKNGAYAYDGNKTYHIKAHKIKVVEATGAGDAFAAGFVSGTLRKDDIKFALRVGLANAESVIMHKGAKGGLLSYKQVMSSIKKSPGKVKLL